MPRTTTARAAAIPPAWHHTAKARALLDAIRAEDVSVGIHRSIVGPDEWHWQHEALDRLETLRRTSIDEATGIVILDALGSDLSSYDPQACHAWYAVERATPSVQYALNERFGDPVALFGAVPGILGDAANANAMWRALNSTTTKREAA